MFTHTVRPIVVALLLIASSVVTGCSGPQRGPMVPVDLIDSASVPGFETARFPHDVTDPAFVERLTLIVAERRKHANIGPGERLPDAQFLALSGGGQNGAYGAGMLCAWTARGDRPRFTVVTGISTGALMAPFAFLGPDYDHVLRTMYTETTDEDIYTKRGKLAGIFGDALFDSAPLQRLIAETFTEKEMHLIAQECATGRLLLVATTNMDSGRPVIWDIGAIAESGNPGSLELIRKIMLASASIPVAFPPVLFDVEAGGTAYQEMHVDGGAAAQVFIYPPRLNLRELSKEYGVQVHRTAYVIRNGELEPSKTETKMRTLALAGRSIDSLICTQGVGDLYRIYAESVRDGLDFKVAYIPESFTLKPETMFDPGYMKPLFQLGYDAMIAGTVWHDGPPGFEGLKIQEVGR